MICGLLNSPILLTTIGDYEPETSAWITRTEAAGGTIPTATKTAVDAFVVSCKAAGIFTKFRRLNLFCGSNLLSCLSPLVNTSGNTMDVNSGFVSGDYSEPEGLLGAAGKTLQTGLIPNTTVNYNNWHIAAYITAHHAAVGGYELGSIGHPSANIQWRLCTEYGSGIGSIVTAGDYNNGNNPTFEDYGAAIQNGLMLASRISSTSLRVRNTNGTIDEHTTASYTGVQAFPTAEMFVMSAAGNQNAGNHVGGYSIGLGMTQTQMSSYCSIMETFQAAMSRATG